MELGVSVLQQYDTSIEASNAWQSVTDLVRFVDREGFASVWVSEHHVTPEYHYLQNVPVLASLASETDNVTLGAGVFLLPLHNPVHIAELTATIDVISDGRLLLGCGLGYRDEEFSAFGVEKGSRVGRLNEGVELLRRLWTEDNVSFEGQHFQYEDVTINPKPVQDPSPPLLIGGFADVSGKRAAHIGDSWLYGNVADKTELQRQFDIYKQAVADAGREDETFTPPVMREAFVLPDEDEAYETVEPYLRQKYESYSGWGLDEVDFSNFREACRDRFLVGSPETVLEELEDYQEFGVEHMPLRTQYPGMEFDTARRCLETIADEVIPHLP